VHLDLFHKIGRWTALVVIFVFGNPSATNGQLRSQVNLTTEYLSPIHDNRQVETINLHFLYGWERWDDHPFTFEFGLIASRAWGHIIQSGTRLGNAAFGIGPMAQMSIDPFVWRGISPSIKGSVGFLMYTAPFPAGGRHYNNMVRWGFALNYRSYKSGWGFGLNYIPWTHVSNGSGIHDGNPSYEGRGPNIVIKKFLSKD